MKLDLENTSSLLVEMSIRQAAGDELLRCGRRRVT